MLGGSCNHGPLSAYKKLKCNLGQPERMEYSSVESLQESEMTEVFGATLENGIAGHPGQCCNQTVFMESTFPANQIKLQTIN